MKFTDAMRSKARLSITGSTSENGRVPMAYLRPGLPMSLSMTDLSWPRPSQCLTANGHTSSLPLWKWMEMLIISIHHRPITTHRGWSTPIFNLEFSQSYLSEDSWSRSLTSSLERLDGCCPPTTWLSGFSKDLPTHEVNHLTISEKNGWSFMNSWKTIKHSGQFSKQTCHCFVDFCHGGYSCIENKDNSDADLTQ